MDLILYAVTRLAMAVGALICVDAVANTALAAEPSSIAAAMGLLIIADTVVYSNQEQDSAVIEHLRALRDRVLRAFSTSISSQGRDPYAPPEPRDERLASEREELKRLFTELSEVQQGIIAMLEERSSTDASYDSIQSFVDELDISDRDGTDASG